MKIKFYTLMENRCYKDAFFIFHSGRMLKEEDGYFYWLGELHTFTPVKDKPTFRYDNLDTMGMAKFQPIERDEDNQRLMDMMIEHGVWPDSLRGLKV